MTIHHDQYLLGIEHRAYTHRNGCLRHLVHVVVEETGVGDDRIGRQRLHACARAEGRARLVEGDVSVRTDTTQEEIHATYSLHACLVACALSLHILGVAVEDVHILRLDVDMAEEIVPHERVIAFGVLFRQAYVLIHVEGNHVLERDHSLLVQLDQVLIHTQRRRAGRQS